MIDASNTNDRPPIDLRERGFNVAFKLVDILSESDMTDEKLALFKVSTFRLETYTIDNETIDEFDYQVHPYR